MDRIINILLLVIIFVFDPLAISLVVAANYAFDIANRKNIYGETEGATLEEQAKYTDWGDYTDEDEERMDVIGQNGNDGEHYEKELDRKGYQLENNIKKVLKKGSEVWKILLKNGRVVNVPKKEAQKYSYNKYEKPDLSKRYM
jgi:hypothetical protein